MLKGGLLSINIKNPDTVALVRELADRTGETLTSAVETSVRERLHRLDEQARKLSVEEMLEIGRDVRQRLDAAGEDLSTDWLYDPETGLPR